VVRGKGAAEFVARAASGRGIAGGRCGLYGGGTARWWVFDQPWTPGGGDPKASCFAARTRHGRDWIT
ncbi:hypothetical protein N9A93_05160, partial [Akkermansiaceae bacterium]|nr:hypothetical protein [Akkermansiaceae bacterium]